jgi:Tetratricopeptide repeat
VVFVADDLVAWLVGLLADAGRKKLTTLVLGSDQERALRQAAAAAIESTARALDPSGGDRAARVAMVVSEVFREPSVGAALAGQATLLEAMQAEIAERLAVLDDAAVTGTGQSSAEVLGVSGGVLAQTLAGHLVREIMVRGSGGGALAPLADQLNHDMTHLQGQRLEGMLAQLADQVQVLAAAGTATVASRPVRLLPRPALLAGREELLAGLDARFTGAGKDGPQIAVLCGLGGAGKTTVALEYAYRHLAEVGVAWQFDAEDPTVLAAGFAELAAQLGVRDVAGTRDPVTSVHGVLAAYTGQWLLVFDNVPGRAAVEAFLPPAGPGQVLITSQNQNWPAGQAVQVPVLDTEVAARFLVSRTGDADGQAAAVLGAELGGLPLALEQAAAYIGASGGSLARYLESFRQRRARLLARGEPAGHSRTVATTWSLAFTQLELSAPQAVALLRLLACCAPEPIPVRLLFQPRPGLAGGLSGEAAALLAPLLEDDLAVDDAVAELRRFSLITPAGDELVSVHRLVQAVTADQMPADLAGQWRQATAALVGAALPAEPWMSGTWPVYAVLLPHAQAALPDDSEGMARLATYLGSSGSYAAARDLQRKTLNARERALGSKHPDALAARHEFGRWTGEAGELAAARDLFAGLLPMREQVLGAQHPYTLITRYELARWTGEAGDPAAARDQFTGLLPAFEQVLGPQHPYALTSRANLARWSGQAGDPAAARDLFAGLLPAFEQVLGAQHPDTRAARHELAIWTAEPNGEPSTT